MYLSKQVNNTGWKELILKILPFLGVNGFCRQITRGQPRILMFHKVYPEGEHHAYSDYIELELFERLIAYLSRYFQLVTLRDLCHFKERHGYYPDHTVVITFDDGFKSFADYVFPILARYHVPATLFICPALISSGQLIWPEQVFHAYENNCLEMEPGANVEQWVASLKSLSQRDRNEELAKRIHVDHLNVFEVNDSNKELLCWNELRDLCVSDLLEIGSHSLNHPILAHEGDHQAKTEIEGSKRLIENELGQDVTSFCYPNGLQGDFLERDWQLVKSSGYSAAVSSMPGVVCKTSNPFSLPRLGGDFSSFAQARKYVDGVETIQRRIMGEGI